MWPRINNNDLKLATPFSHTAAAACERANGYRGFVYFDAGSVILDLDWDTYFEALQNYIPQNNKVTVEEFCKAFAESGIARKWSVGELGPFQYHQAVKNFLLTHFQSAASQDLTAESLKKISSVVVGPMRPRVFRMIQKLRDAGFYTGLLSNSNAWHEADIERQMALQDHLDVVLFSQDLGCEKPEREIYEIAHRSAAAFVKQRTGKRLTVENIYFVDDSPANIRAATDYGFQARLVCLLNQEILSKAANAAYSNAELTNLSADSSNLVFGDLAARRVEAILSPLF